MNQRAARVLQLARVPRPGPGRAEELGRLLARPVEIDIEMVERVPDKVARLVAARGAVAVIAESSPADPLGLLAAVSPVPVLRPIFERRRGLHAGPPEYRFCGYGRLGGDGSVQPLPDGALAT